jgi:hypothetical protein
VSANKEQKIKGLIQAALDAEATLRNFLSKNQITGVVTRAPIEKLIVTTQNYKQSN